MSTSVLATNGDNLIGVGPISRAMGGVGIAYQPNARLSFGLSGIVEYANLDLGEGSDWDYGFGLQGGTIFRPINDLSLGLNIITPRKLEFKKVADFDAD